MKKTLLILCLTLLTTIAAADNLATYFKDTNGCLIIYNVNAAKMVQEYNPTQCAQEIAPASTFKIALSLMAFDQHLITQKTIFKWDGHDRGMAMWNKNQTPRTWLQNSVVWVSQTLTPQLGMKKIKHYLHEFHYGNEDFSGDPGEHNGLERAWLGSSLKISPDQQLPFLIALVNNNLPVSKTALSDTKDNLYIETSAKGWRLYGKTGATMWTQSSTTKKPITLQTSWFVGYVEKQNQRYIFIVNLNNQKQATTPPLTGARARAIAIGVLRQLGLF